MTLQFEGIEVWATGYSTPGSFHCLVAHCGSSQHVLEAQLPGCMVTTPGSSHTDYVIFSPGTYCKGNLAARVGATSEEVSMNESQTSGGLCRFHCMCLLFVLVPAHIRLDVCTHICIYVYTHTHAFVAIEPQKELYRQALKGRPFVRRHGATKPPRKSLIRGSCARLIGAHCFGDSSDP